jgi:hypothetical protein
MNKSLILSLILSAGLSAAAEVKATSISEGRDKELIASGSSMMHHRGGLTINLDIRETGLDRASEYRFELRRVQDSTGLQLGLSGFNSKDFSKIDRKHMFFFEKNAAEKKDRLKLELNLETSKREAKTVSIDADLIVREGEAVPVTNVSLDKLPSSPLKIPLLTASGGSLTLQAKQKKGEISFDLVDPKGVINAYEVVDAAGKVISTGYNSMGFNGKQSVSLNYDGAPATAFLKVTCVKDLKERRIPVKLQDLPLP